MCGIAGIMFSDGKKEVGEQLYEMLKSLQHRGMDSAGVIVYDDKPGDWLVRVVAEDGEEALSKIKYRLNVSKYEKPKKLNDGTYLIEFTVPRSVKLEEIREVIRKLKYPILSLGRYSVISKDVGLVDDVNRVYGFKEQLGTHGIGHVRFSTESAVDAIHAHPFQTPEFPDIAIVHNGQITNYWKMRELLELEGHVFQTDNDSELIIHYIVNKLRKGYELEEALKSAVNDLDGPFAFLLSMPEGIGMARDRLGLRPLVVAEGDGVLAAARRRWPLGRSYPSPRYTT